MQDRVDVDRGVKMKLRNRVRKLVPDGYARIDRELTVMPTSATQRSPMAKSFTFFPISTMCPMASWPGIS